MKITIDFENGMQVAVKPENLTIGNANDTTVAIGFKTDTAAVPILFFSGQLATKEEVEARPKAEQK